MSNEKVTNYTLLPNQYKFLFDVDEEKLNKDRVHIDVSLYQGGFTCCPKDTEFLSPQGWVTIDKLTMNDKLAVYHDDGSIVFEQPRDIFTYPADTWYEFDTRGTKQKLCPNHQIVYFNDRTDRDMLKPLKIAAADYVKNKNNSHKTIRNYFKVKGGAKSGYSEHLLRLFVAYQADGWNIRDGKKFKVGFHLKKEAKVARLHDLLKGAGVDYTFTVRKTGSKKGYVDFRCALPFVDKSYPTQWYSLDSSELEIIGHEVCFWDCSHKNDQRSTTYYTNKKQDRDFIQFCWAACGYCTSAYERRRDISITTNGKKYDYKNKVEYTTSRSAAKPIRMGNATTTKAKGGELKYCPSTSTGMWLARYKNYIFVTGNS